MSLSIIAVIPARLQATRFPGKLLKDLCGSSVIMRTYQATLSTGLFEKVIVATDSDLIYNEVISNGGECVRSKKDHDCGSDRIAEAVEHLNADIIINVQGDEPFTKPEDLQALIDVFIQDKDNSIDLASLMHVIEGEEIDNPNNVKVITDINSNAIYFSRSPIPFHRDLEFNHPTFKHIGIYAFRKKALLDFYHTAATPLEKKEKIECLRYIEKGKKIKMIATQNRPIGIDVPEDLEQAIEKWQSQ